MIFNTCFDLCRSSSGLFYEVSGFVYRTYNITAGDVCVLDCVACSLSVFLGVCFFWLCVSVVSNNLDFRDGMVVICWFCLLRLYM